MLHNHQLRVIEKITGKTRGIIVYHSMGSGKTLTALEIISKIQGEKLVVAPASAISNFTNEAKKHGKIIDSNTSIVTYEKCLRSKLFNNKQLELIIFDEAHRLRNKDTDTYKYFKSIIDKAKKIVFLTGTAEYNEPSDIGALINLINPKEKFPDTINAFSKKYLDKSNNLINKEKLSAILSKYVDYYQNPPQNSFYPDIERIQIFVEMSAKQTKLYKYLSKKLPWHLRRAVEKNFPLSLSESSLVNMYSSAIRQVSVSTFKFDKNAVLDDNTKLKLAYSNLISRCNQSFFRGIVFSNYIEAGLEQYKKLLINDGYNPLVFTGNISHKKKDEIISTFNAIDEGPQILLISSSGGEGIDLKGTNLIQILEPHFNLAKINQVISRAVRYKSHYHLEKNEQKVKVEEYFSTLPKNFIQRIFSSKPSTSIDEFLYNSSITKQSVMDQIVSLIH